MGLLTVALYLNGVAGRIPQGESAERSPNQDTGWYADPTTNMHHFLLLEGLETSAQLGEM